MATYNSQQRGAYAQVAPTSQKQEGRAQRGGAYRSNGMNPFASSPSNTYHQIASPGLPSPAAFVPPYAVHQSPGQYSRIGSQEKLPYGDTGSYPASSSSHHSSPRLYYGERSDQWERSGSVSTTKQLSESTHTPALAAREKYIIRREAALLAGENSTSFSRFSEKVAPPAISKKSARKCWIIIAITFFIAIAFGVCVGVGIYYARKNVTEDNLAAKAAAGS